MQSRWLLLLCAAVVALCSAGTGLVEARHARDLESVAGNGGDNRGGMETFAPVVVRGGSRGVTVEKGSGGGGDGGGDGGGGDNGGSRSSDGDGHSSDESGRVFPDSDSDKRAVKGSGGQDDAVGPRPTENEPTHVSMMPPPEPVGASVPADTGAAAKVLAKKQSRDSDSNETRIGSPPLPVRPPAESKGEFNPQEKSSSGGSTMDVQVHRDVIPHVIDGQDANLRLEDELSLATFEPLSLANPEKQWLGIGRSMAAQVLWTPTIWSLNSTGGGHRIPMIYLDPAPCRIRRKQDPFYRCLVLGPCTMGGVDVRKSLSITPRGVFLFKLMVDENDPRLPRFAAGQHADTGNGDSSKLPRPLDFRCTFLEGGRPGRNTTLTQSTQIRAITVRPVPSTAQVIKPTKLKTAIVGTTITVEAVLDQPRLSIISSECSINNRPVKTAFDLGRGLYTLEYTVRDGDTDRPLGKLPFHCSFEDLGGNNATLGPMNLQSWFSVNANPPRFKSIAIVAPARASKGVTRARVGDRVIVGLTTQRCGLRIKPQKCTLNGIDVSPTFNVTDCGGTISLNVTTGQSDWFEGQLPIDCWMKDVDGNAAHLQHFTDGNQLAGDAHTPRLMDYFPSIMLAVGFAVVSVASGRIATHFPAFGMPLITGYLLTGILAGPEALRLIPEQSIRSLRFIDELSLAVIAISAGRKLYLPKMHGRWRTIGWVMSGLIIFEYGIGAATIVALHPYIQFMHGMTQRQITSVALMAGALVCARSPASAVAIVSEMQAEGPFTDTILGVTVLSDVSVIALFALTSLVSNSLLANRSRSSSVFWVFAAQMLISSLLGVVLAWVMTAIFGTRSSIAQRLGRAAAGDGGNGEYGSGSDRVADKSTGNGAPPDFEAGDSGPSMAEQSLTDSPSQQRLKSGMLDGREQQRWTDDRRRRKAHRRRDAPKSCLSKILDALECGSVMALGFATFVLGHFVDPYLQPLIVCMVGGFWVTNFSPYRKELSRVLNMISGGVMVAFFTLAGAALDLKSLSQTLFISSIVFIGRIFGIIIGAWFGGWVAGEPTTNNRVSWMAYVTQAGVTLGLAKKIHLENSTWGGGFATVIIANVVLNQLAGPPLFRLAIELVGEAKKIVSQPSSGMYHSDSMTSLNSTASDAQETSHMGRHGRRVIQGDATRRAGALVHIEVLVVGNDMNALSVMNGVAGRTVHGVHPTLRIVSTSEVVSCDNLASSSTTTTAGDAGDAGNVGASGDSNAGTDPADGVSDDEAPLLSTPTKNSSKQAVRLRPAAISYICDLAATTDLVLLMLPSDLANATICDALLRDTRCLHLSVVIRAAAPDHQIRAAEAGFDPVSPSTPMSAARRPLYAPLQVSGRVRVLPSTSSPAMISSHITHMLS